MEKQTVPRRTIIGAALVAATGLLPSSAALAARSGKAGRTASSGTGARPVSHDEMRAAIDKSAIVDLVSRLGKWLDLKQFEDPAITEALFAPNILVGTPGRTGGAAEGIPAVVVKARKRHAGIGCQHLYTNVLVELHGDTASAEADLLATFVPDPQKPSVFSQLGTRYQFAFVRTGQGWKFTRIDDRTIWRRDEMSSERAG